jgi:hypothetical protein
MSSQEPWDQEHFEDLLAKWIAACDQPFTIVSEPEFRALLEYTHHPSKTPLHIPKEDSIRSRIMAMGDDILHNLKNTFKVISIPYRLLRLLAHSFIGKYLEFLYFP